MVEAKIIIMFDSRFLFNSFVQMNLEIFPLALFENVYIFDRIIRGITSKFYIIWSIFIHKYQLFNII